MPYYAVQKGRNPGIYNTWDECSAQINGFSGAIYKKFTQKSDAENFVAGIAHAEPKPVHKAHIQSIHLHADVHSKQIPLSEVSQERDIVSFVDGSSIGNGSATAVAGYGVYIPSMDVKRSVKLPPGSTNNQGELHAILMALQIVGKTDKRHVIVSDSMYSIQCITEWSSGWERRGWTKSGGGQISNVELIKKIFELVKDNDHVVFSHINSHTGRSGFLYEGNDMADKLASGVIEEIRRPTKLIFE